jgi:DNA adenine methylase
MNMFEPIQPILPVAPWLGGKRNLAKRVIARINAVPHQSYVETFVGMGGIFLRRDRRPKCEVINDWSEDVATFFRVLEHHYVAFLEMIRFQISSRANFEKLARQDPSTLTDLQRSARFLYLQRLAFGGKVAGSRTFGVAPGLGGRFDISKLASMLEDLHERMSGVIVERLSWAKFIERWDRDGTLFYLDPPYWGCEDDYGKGLFGRDEFEQMARIMAGIKGRFILSINDRPEIRDLFRAFTIEEVPTTYSIGSGSPQKVTELIISN